MTSTGASGPGAAKSDVPVPVEIPKPADVFVITDDVPAVVSAEPVLEAADVVAAAVLAVDGVAGLHTGTFGEVATYLPGRRVGGVRIANDATEVHLVLEWGAPVLATADRVRIAVQGLVDTPVNIAVQDVVDPSAANADQTRPTKETA